MLLLEHRNKGNIYAVASFMNCQGILFLVLFAWVLTTAVLRPLVHYTKVVFQLCKCIPVTQFYKEISIKASMCVLKLFFKIAFLVMILECYMILKLVLE